MAVAPSFTNYKILSNPFLKNNKPYITVQNPNTGNKRDVRWYEPTEYKRLYGIIPNGFDNLKQARGFSKGPIQVIRNLKPSDNQWVENSIARYAVGIGWHFTSTDTIPNLPSHLRLIPLTWDEFKLDDRHPKTTTQLSNLLSKKEKTTIAATDANQPLPIQI